MKIEIDKSSGFCYGVVKAVQSAERNLKSVPKGGGKLYSLGDIVHNESELSRLHKIGLEVIDIEQMSHLKGTKVLIRAHGEPPSTYQIAQQNNITLIDCTCPVVLALQKKISQTKGQIVIFGKNGHAEVNGLITRAQQKAVVVENKEDVEKLATDCILNFDEPITLFSQTTKDPTEFQEVSELLKEKMKKTTLLTSHNTICRQVANRHQQLKEFASKHSIIIFVSGKESSNGHVLYSLCRKENPRSYHIQSLSEIDKNWFKAKDSIGICGATSTPLWQLESVRKFLKITLNGYICANLNRLLYGNYSRF